MIQNKLTFLLKHSVIVRVHIDVSTKIVQFFIKVLITKN